MTAEQFVEAFHAYGSIRAVARCTGLSFRIVRNAYLEAIRKKLIKPIKPGGVAKHEQENPQLRIDQPAFQGVSDIRPTLTFLLPHTGTKHYLLTSAQNNTQVKQAFWKNLSAYRKYLGASLYVSRFTYIKHGLGALGDKATWVKKEDAIGEKQTKLWWDPRLDDHILDTRVKLAPGLVFCGEMNISPTAVRPLSGLLTYTGRDSAIFPHAKSAMESVPSGKHEPTKFCYTTGTVTERNYIQRKEGLKGEFHHVHGALHVEVLPDGSWFVRQLNADRDGSFYDLDLKVSKSKVTKGHRVEAIQWGDVHCADIDPEVVRMAWGKHKDSMVRVLKPHKQFYHDVLDFRSQSHHETKSPHKLFYKHVHGLLSVCEELKDVARFFEGVVQHSPKDCKHLVVASNHHNHLGRWLEEQNPPRHDPANAAVWLHINALVYDWIAEHKTLPSYLEQSLRHLHPESIRNIRFLKDDEEYILLHDKGGGIECGLHGHAGPDGSRGTTANLNKLGRRINKAHDHKATIQGGTYSAGVCCRLDPYWTTGPSSWSHSHIVVYPNGKRAIITMWKGRWHG